MAVHAHPDDEASKGAATMAKYVHEGATVMVVTMTGGERGSVLNPKLLDDPAYQGDLTDVRRAEMAASAAALGVEHRWMGYVDSGLPEGDPLPPLPKGSFATLDPAEAAEPLAALIREFKPDVLTTYDPSSDGYAHPDHIQTHIVSVQAVAQAGDPDYAPHGVRPWAVSKVYYDRGFSLARSRALDQAMKARGLESPFGEWLERHAHRPERVQPVTTRIEVAEYFPQRDAALRAHASQIDPDGWFFAVPRDIEAQVWPWEEFELAHSRVEVDIPETDLFTGLR
jgi:mycothiol S-conjugate amidase